MIHEKKTRFYTQTAIGCVSNNTQITGSQTKTQLQSQHNCALKLEKNVCPTSTLSKFGQGSRLQPTESSGFWPARKSKQEILPSSRQLPKDGCSALLQESDSFFQCSPGVLHVTFTHSCWMPVEDASNRCRLSNLFNKHTRRTPLACNISNASKAKSAFQNFPDEFTQYPYNELKCNFGKTFVFLLIHLKALGLL